MNDGSEDVTFSLNSYAQKNYLRMEDNDADSGRMFRISTTQYRFI